MNEDRMKRITGAPSLPGKKYDDVGQIHTAVSSEGSKQYSGRRTGNSTKSDSATSIDHVSTLPEDERLLPTKKCQIQSGTGPKCEGEKQCGIVKGWTDDQSGIEEDVEGQEDETKDDSDQTDHTEVSSPPPDGNKIDRRKMKRFRLTHNQTRFLLSEFIRGAHPDAAQRERLSKEIPGLNPRQVQVWFQNRRAKLKQFSKTDQERMLRSWALPANFDTTRLLSSSSRHGNHGVNDSSEQALAPAQSRTLVWRYLNPTMSHNSIEPQGIPPTSSSMPTQNYGSWTKSKAESGGSTSSAQKSAQGTLDNINPPMFASAGNELSINSSIISDPYGPRPQNYGPQFAYRSCSAPTYHSNSLWSPHVNNNEISNGNDFQTCLNNQNLAPPIPNNDCHKSIEMDRTSQAFGISNYPSLQQLQDHSQAYLASPSEYTVQANNANSQTTFAPHSAPAYAHALYPQTFGIGQGLDSLASLEDTSFRGGPAYSGSDPEFPQPDDQENVGPSRFSAPAEHSQMMEEGYPSHSLSTSSAAETYPLPREEDCMAMNGFFYPLLPYDIFQTQ